jgi:hypothetical protein
VLDEHDGIGARQIEAEAANVGGQEEAVDRRVGVERLDDGVPVLRGRTAVEAHVRHARHRLPKEVVLDEVEHLPDLAEDEHPVRRRGSVVQRGRLGRRRADAAVEEDLPVRRRSTCHKQTHAGART